MIRGDNFRATNPADKHAGYPTRIASRNMLDRFTQHTRTIIIPGTTPTADQLVEAACESVRFTRRLNSYPGALITGQFQTAGHEKGKNGSIFLPTERITWLGHSTLMSEVFRGSVPPIDNNQGVGIYVTSPKRKARPEDIEQVGIVIADMDSCERLHDVPMARSDIGELSTKAKGQYGNLLAGLNSLVNIAYGIKIMELAR